MVVGKARGDVHLLHSAVIQDCAWPLVLDLPPRCLGVNRQAQILVDLVIEQIGRVSAR